MADEVWVFSVTVPAGTASAAPQVTATTMPPRIVRRIEVTVPPGPAGSLGFRIGMAGQQVLPVNAGSWIITDNEHIGWDVSNLPDSGAWQVIGYNTGSQPHTIQVRYLVDVPQLSQPGQPVTPLPADLLAPVPDALLATASADWASPQLPTLDLTDPATAAVVLGGGA